MDLAFLYFPQEDMSHREEASQASDLLGQGEKHQASSHLDGLGQVTSLLHFPHL